ncbi:hypothetical protein LAX5112_00181 [Roseibium alexandrii]|uniref:Uncharacterized protein n=1 Tax=Roseibium alexandrii TaxID=388408 RepID=A0A0M6ZPQ9_9HYPH|nr:hypothetical protein LAX5112_00181 [Roseibium alexandrii]
MILRVLMSGPYVPGSKDAYLKNEKWPPISERPIQFPSSFGNDRDAALV